MKQTFYILAALQFLCSCSREPESKPKNIVHEVEEEYFPKVIDTSSLTGRNKSFEEFSTSNYKPLYLGNKKSTLFVDYFIPKYTKDPNLIKPVGHKATKDDSLKEDYLNKYESYFTIQNSDDLINQDSADIRIYIDTSQVVRSITLKNWNTDTIIYNSYPVIIQNEMNSDIIVGYGFQIPLIIEVENDQNNWIPIETKYLYPCGNGLRSMLLPKDEIIITSLPISEGKSKTKMRLKLGKNYSNEVWGNLTIKNSNAR